MIDIEYYRLDSVLEIFFFMKAAFEWQVAGKLNSILEMQSTEHEIYIHFYILSETLIYPPNSKTSSFPRYITKKRDKMHLHMLIQFSQQCKTRDRPLSQVSSLTTSEALYLLKPQCYMSSLLATRLHLWQTYQFWLYCSLYAVMLYLYLIRPWRPCVFEATGVYQLLCS